MLVLYHTFCLGFLVKSQHLCECVISRTTQYPQLFCVFSLLSLCSMLGQKNRRTRSQHIYWWHFCCHCSRSPNPFQIPDPQNFFLLSSHTHTFRKYTEAQKGNESFIRKQGHDDRL